MSFRPSIHGWPFPAPPYPEEQVLSTATAPTEPGIGGGLCWAALDRYLRGVRIPRETPSPEPGDPLFAELARRHAAAEAGVWPRVRAWQDRPDTSWRTRLPAPVAGGGDLASLSRGEWRGIRKRLEAGQPVLLTLLDPADGYRQARAARQVLATAWDASGKRVNVSIYDPARPEDDDVRLSFSRQGPLDARTSDGRRVRAFFAVPYDRDTARSIRAESFEDRSVIGLNRTVRGRVVPLAARRRIELIARDPDGALLHFHRRDGKSWEGANITDGEDFGNFELHSDPVAIRVGRSLHVFGLSYVGDLLHFRYRRKWSVANRTDHRKAGPRFRFAGRPVPVAGPGRSLGVLGTDKDGGLIHYLGHPVKGWKAEQVAGSPLAGDPVVGWTDTSLHVAGLSPNGRIQHWEWDGERWVSTDSESIGSGGRPPRIHSRLDLRIHDGVVHLAGRTRRGKLVVVSRDGNGAWSRHDLISGAAGDPVFTGGPAGLHLFAPSADDGLLHAWWDNGDWRTEDVTASRPGLPLTPLKGGLAAWGDTERLRVWGRGEGALWIFDWRADSDWTVDALNERAGVLERHRPGDDPVLLSDGRGRPHLFCTDGRGTVLHFESAAWHEPKGDAATAASKPTPLPEPAVPAPTPKAAIPEEAEPVEVEPVEVEPVAVESDEVEPVEIEPVAVQSDEVEPVEVEPIAMEPIGEAGSQHESEPVVEVESGDDPTDPDEPTDLPLPTEEPETGAPAIAGYEPGPGYGPALGGDDAEDEEEYEPLPLLDDPADAAPADVSRDEPDAETAPGDGEVDELPYLDFEADGSPVGKESPAAKTTQSAENKADSPEASEANAAEANAAEEANATADADTGQDDGDQPDAGSGEEGPEDPAPQSQDPHDIEPMDLELLHTWPPPPLSMRKRKRKDSSDDGQREAS